MTSFVSSGCYDIAQRTQRLVNVLFTYKTYRHITRTLLALCRAKPEYLRTAHKCTFMLLTMYNAVD
jgi:hypothetical protein